MSSVATESGSVIAVTPAGVFQYGCGVDFDYPNGSECWRGLGSPGRTAHVSSVTPSSAHGVLLAITPGGILEKAQNDPDWLPSTGLTVAEVTGISIDPSNALRAAAATTGGPFVTSDGGASWQRISGTSSKTPPLTITIAHNPSTIFIASATAIEKSIDGGISWSTLPISEKKIYNLQFALAPSDDDTMYAAIGSGVVRSIDGGRTFFSLGYLPPADDYGLSWPSIPPIAPPYSSPPPMASGGRGPEGATGPASHPNRPLG